MNNLTKLERVHTHSRVEANGCWTWTGKVNGRGYGYVVGGTGSVAAHRFSFEAHGRNIPAGLVLDHLCNNKLCVNPDHLNPTTDRENIMRADGACAKNARKTHCKWGHEFTPENTYRTPSGARECRTCKLAIKRKWRRAHGDTPDLRARLAAAEKALADAKALAQRNFEYGAARDRDLVSMEAALAEEMEKTAQLKKVAAYHLWATGPAFNQGEPYPEHEVTTIARRALASQPKEPGAVCGVILDEAHRCLEPHPCPAHRTKLVAILEGEPKEPETAPAISDLGPK